MSTAVRIRRKNGFNLFREARKLESFDEFPMLRPEVDPQLHASRNSVDQPFYLTCAKDSVIAQASGAARVEFASGPVRYFDLGPGDFVYVPAGSAHHIHAVKDGIQIRYKAREPGQETISWSCQNCGRALFSHRFDATAEPAQLGYQAGCERFNADRANRQCAACDAEHPPVDLVPFRWKAVAEAMSAGEEE